MSFMSVEHQQLSSFMTIFLKKKSIFYEGTEMLRCKSSGDIYIIIFLSILMFVSYMATKGYLRLVPPSTVFEWAVHYHSKLFLGNFLLFLTNFFDRSGLLT